MKKFACGDVVPGCETTFVGDTVDDVLGSVARHAADTHGLSPVPSAVADQVRLHIVTT